MSHALLSPSAWERWSKCPGSVEASKGIPNRSSVYADEGTCAHAVLEAKLKGDEIQPAYNVANHDEPPRHVDVTQDMLDHIDTVLEQIQAIAEEHELFDTPTVHAERKVQPRIDPALDAHLKGTADVTIVSAVGVDVIDLKYGRGNAVDVGTDDAPNGQGFLYAIGALDTLGIKNPGRVRFHIAQPRMEHHPDGTLRTVTISPEVVVKRREVVRLAAQAALEPHAPRVPSEDACRWCPVRATCRERADAMDAILGVATRQADAVREFAAMTDTSAMPVEDLVAITKNASLLRGFLDDVESYVKDMLTSHNAPEEVKSVFKLVHGTSHRRWAQDEKTTLKGIQSIRWTDPITGKSTSVKKADITETKTRSPAQVEKLFKARRKAEDITETHMEAFYRLIEKPEGALVLTDAADPRPAAVPDTDSMFPEDDNLFGE